MYVVSFEFTEWAKAHALHNMKDVKDLLEDFYSAPDLRNITLDQVKDWMTYIEDTDNKLGDGEKNDTRRREDSGSGGSPDKLDGGAVKG